MKPRGLLQLGILLLAGCNTQEPGITVGIELMHAPSGAHHPIESRQEHEGIQNDLGYTIWFDQAFVTIASVELQPCATGQGTPLIQELGQWLQPIGTAYAHVDSGPAGLGSPVVSNLLESPHLSKSFGVLTPPPNAYCALELVFGAADDDAIGLPTHEEMSGKTVLIRGRQQLDSGTQQAFVVESSEQTAVRWSFDEGGSEPLQLQEPGFDITLVLSLCHEHAFDGLDFAHSEPQQLATRFLENLARSLTVHARKPL